MEYNKKSDSNETVNGSGEKLNEVHSSKSSLTSLDLSAQVCFFVFCDKILNNWN